MNMKLPFYAHLAFVLIILWFLFYGIYIGQDILLPLGFSFLIAVLLHPLEKLFERIKIPRVIVHIAIADNCHCCFVWLVYALNA